MFRTIFSGGTLRLCGLFLMAGLWLSFATSCNPGGGSGGSSSGAGGGGSGGGSGQATLLRWSEYDRDFAWPAKRAWNNSLSSTTADGHWPHHNGYDLCIALGQTPQLEGKFHYGDVRKDLEGEDVGLYVHKAGSGGWIFCGDAQTNSDGRAYWSFPAAINGAGLWYVKMVVYGDLTCADMLVRVLGGTQKAIVTDIDGTLTINDEQQIAATLGELLDIYNMPRQFDDANKVMCQLARQGYEIVYLTARPYWLSRASRHWLRAKGYPLGQVYTYSGAGLTMGSATSDAKRDRIVQLQSAGLRFDYAFGNADTDITAYDQAGIPKNVTYIIGPLAGHNGTVALPSYGSLYGSLVSTPSHPYRAVLLIVDGLRPDALDYYMSNLAPPSSALKRLFGTKRLKVEQNETVAPSVTFANHASIITGRNPASTGLVGNDFLDRSTAQPYSFVGSNYSVDQVLSVYQDEGLANQALKVPTLYEQMDASGRYGVCSGHMYFRGSEYLYPSLTELSKFITDAAQYDADVVTRMINRLDGVDTPDLMTVYLPGLDHHAHDSGNVGGVALSPLSLANSQLEWLYNVVDPQVARLESHLQSMGILGQTAWVICSDHGMRDTPDDDAHAIGIDPLGLDNELDKVLEDSPYDDIFDKPLGTEGDFDCFAGCNGGLLHVSLRNRATNAWADAPRLNEDILPVIGSIQQHRLNGQLQNNGQDAVEEVLVRRAFGQPYEVVRPTRVRIHFDSVYVRDDQNTFQSGEWFLDLRANGKVFARMGQYNVNNGDTITLNASFEVDIMPGMNLLVECYGEDDDGLGIWDSAGLAQVAISNRTQFAGLMTQQTTSSSTNDFDLRWRAEIVSLPTYSYPQAPGFGNYCPLSLLNTARPDYCHPVERLSKLNRDDRSGDIILLPAWRDGYYFGGGNKANHGSLYPEDSWQTFFVGGVPLAQSTTLVGGSNVDIAATLAQVLDIPLRGAEGVSRVTAAELPLLQSVGGPKP